MSLDLQRELRIVASWCFRHCIGSDLVTGSRQLAADEFTIEVGLEGECAVMPKAYETLLLARRVAFESEALTLLDYDYCSYCGRLYCIDVEAASRAPLRGNANDVSWGFFDQHGLPGCDTWLYFDPLSYLGLIYGWVPNEISAPVGNGMYWLGTHAAQRVANIPQTRG